MSSWSICYRVISLLRIKCNAVINKLEKYMNNSWNDRSQGHKLNLRYRGKSHVHICICTEKKGENEIESDRKEMCQYVNGCHGWILVAGTWIPIILFFTFLCFNSFKIYQKKNRENKIALAIENLIYMLFFSMKKFLHCNKIILFPCSNLLTFLYIPLLLLITFYLVLLWFVNNLNSLEV